MRCLEELEFRCRDALFTFSGWLPTPADDYVFLIGTLISDQVFDRLIGVKS